MDWHEHWVSLKASAVTLATTWGVRIIAALVIAIVGWIVARWVGARVRVLAERSGHVDRTLVGVVSKLARLSVLAIVLVTALDKLGVDTASFLAFLGAAGLAIGLALKDTASDVAGGIVLLVLRPFSVGEDVMIGTTGGTVDELGIFQTSLVTFEGVPIVIPNSRVRTSDIQNFTRAQKRRIDLTIGVSYDADLDRVRAILLETVAADSRVLDDPEPLVDVTNLGESSVDVLVRVWVPAKGLLPAKLAIIRAIKQRLDAEGIEIPFPQRVVRTLPSAVA